MDIKIKDSDILCSPSGEYTCIDGIEEALQRALICAQISKGSFIYNKALGTELRAIDTDSELKTETARQLINEALMGTGIRAEVNTFAKPEDGNLKLKLTVHYLGKTMTTEVTLYADV